MKKPQIFKNNKKFQSISLIFSEIALDGLVLNFLVFCVFGLSFTWYSWLGWGFIPYVFGEVVPRIIVKLKQRLK